jgi:hypothetical protein
MFTCIYCQKNEPDVSPSEAHIFPDAMGGVSSTIDTVCKDCNHKINKNFEQSEVSSFTFFQSIWGIKSRRGRIKGVPATAEYEGKRFNISLDDKGLPKTPLIFCGKDNMGKEFYSIIGPAAIVEEKKKEIEAKNPSIVWNEKDLKNIPLPNLVIKIASDIGRMSLRRLAAKVAYERWGQLRGTAVLDDAQYTNIRDFILNGTESSVLCGVLSDLRLLNGMLNFPIGQHGVVIIAHPRSRVLGSFVTFYSLFYFWVILSPNYQALAPFDNALIEDPQCQKVNEPLFRTNTGNLLVRWNYITHPFLSDPEEVAILSMKYAINKFQKSQEETANLKKMKHILAKPATREGG